MLSDPVSVAVRRDVLQRAIDQPGQRLHRLSAASRQNEREIVAQRAEVAISGKNRRLQIAAGQRGKFALGHSAGKMKRNMRLEFCLHAQIALIELDGTVETSNAWLNLAAGVLRPDREFVEFGIQARFDV